MASTVLEQLCEMYPFWLPLKHLNSPKNLFANDHQIHIETSIFSVPSFLFYYSSSAWSLDAFSFMFGIAAILRIWKKYSCSALLLNLLRPLSFLYFLSHSNLKANNSVNCSIFFSIVALSPASTTFSSSATLSLSKLSVISIFVFVGCDSDAFLVYAP